MDNYIVEIHLQDVPDVEYDFVNKKLILKMESVSDDFHVMSHAPDSKRLLCHHTYYLADNGVIREV